MAILNYLLKLFKKKESKPDLEYVQETPVPSADAAYQARSTTETTQDLDPIDFLDQAHLEGDALDANLSKESIERWISSGLLMPEELKMAEKLVKGKRKP